MKETVFFILLAAILLFMYLLSMKKKKERQMREDLDSLIEREEWHRVSIILRKQLIIWSIIAIATTVLVVVSFIMGERKYALLVMAGIYIYRSLTLAKSYNNSKYNEHWQQSEAARMDAIKEMTAQVQKLLGEYNVSVTRLRADLPPQTLKEMWMESREKGRKEGFVPVLLIVDSAFCESLDEMVTDKERFMQWQQQVLSQPTQDGKALLKKQFDQNKEDYETDLNLDWQIDIVGTPEPCEAMNDIPLLDGYIQGTVLLAEVPVSEPWQVFAYIPYGGWNKCPSPEVHMAVAKYWYERYGAEIMCIAQSLIFHVQQPVIADAMALAEEQFAYSADVLQDYGNLATLAEMNRKSTMWNIFWD